MENQTQELSIIDPKEYGLETSKATSIESAFKPKLIERDAFTEQYESIIKQDLNAETFKSARELRLKLVKVRTGIADIHKSEKAFFLASGKFIDALKNKLTTPIEQMEEKLMEIEKYEQKLESDRKAKLKTDRLELLAPYEVDVQFVSIEEMTDEQFAGFLSTNKTAFEAKKEQERLAELARIEAEKKAEAERLERERLEAERIEAQRLENERLKKEAEAREKELAAERKRLADEQAKKDAAQKAELERLAKEQAEKDRLAKIESDRLAKIAAEEKAKSDKLAAELKAKQEAEDKALADEKARIEAEENERKAKEQALANADDQTKVKDWFIKFDALIKQFPDLKSEAGLKMSTRVKEALKINRALIVEDSKTLL